MARSRPNRRKPAARPEVPPRVINWRAWFTLVGASSVVFGVFAGSGYLMDQPIRGVLVHAPFQRVSALQIEEALGDGLTAGFLSADLGAMQRRLSKLDWVDKATIRRRWSSGLEVVVIEQVAAARWGENGLLNTRGELFLDKARHVPAELPRLDGPPGSEGRVAWRYLELRGQMIEAGLGLAGIELDSRGAWRVTLSNGLIVYLGRKAVAQRIQRFVEVVTPLISSQDTTVAYVDMRYSNGFAVGWQQDARPRLAVAGRAG